MTSDLVKGTSPAIAIVLLLLSGAFIPTGCEEALPPRDAPKDFLAAELSTDTSLMVINLREDDPPPLVTTPWAITGTVQNITDEVIQDSADVRITITLVTRTQPKFTTVVKGAASNLVGFVQVRSGLLTIDTRYPAEFRLLWTDWRWSDGTGIWTPWWNKVHSVIVPNGKNYDETPVIPLDVTASIQLFKHTAPVAWAGVMYLVIRLYPQ
jgi:hypothetical protein